MWKHGAARQNQLPFCPKKPKRGGSGSRATETAETSEEKSWVLVAVLCTAEYMDQRGLKGALVPAL